MTAVVHGVDMAAIGRMVRQRHEQTAGQLRGLREQSAAVIASPERGTGDAADAGTLALESAEQSLVTAALQDQLERLQVALVRLENGTLGICERCQEQVPLPRLEVMPWAAHCVPCQSILDRR
jgi:DnaK suppressor protein